MNIKQVIALRALGEDKQRLFGADCAEKAACILELNLRRKVETAIRLSREYAYGEDRGTELRAVIVKLDKIADHFPHSSNIGVALSVVIYGTGWTPPARTEPSQYIPTPGSAGHEPIKVAGGNLNTLFINIRGFDVNDSITARLDWYSMGMIGRCVQWDELSLIDDLDLWDIWSEG